MGTEGRTRAGFRPNKTLRFSHVVFQEACSPAVPGGVLYHVARRWLPGSSVWKGLAYGVLLFCLFGSIVIEKDNPDFVVFGPAPLAVLLFGVLFPLYGLLLSPMAERLLSPVPPSFLKPRVTAIGYLILTGVAAFGLFRTVDAINTIL